MYGFIMACIELYDTGQSSVTLKSKDLATHGFHKKFQTLEAKPSFRKVSLLPAKLHVLSSAHLWVREFWPQIYSLS